MKKQIINTTGQADIFIKGARVHNLKNIDVRIPHNKLVVVTGLSGSGKSSLTIDTLFAEGQRRYAESLSSYARQFMQRMDKPDVDYITGLSPAIAIEQKVSTRTPRSTVGSMTEIYDFLRLLFARVGDTLSPISGNIVKKQNVSDVVDYIKKIKPGAKILLLTKIKKNKNRILQEELNILMQKGFNRVYANEVSYVIEDVLEDNAILKSIDKLEEKFLIIDRLVTGEFDEEQLHRISDSVDLAFYEGEGDIFLKIDENKKLISFSSRFELDGIQFIEPVPNLFSFNNPYGACPTCEGFGQTMGIDEDLVLPNPNLSVYEGAVAPWKGEIRDWWRINFMKQNKNFPIHKPVRELSQSDIDLLWNGENGIKEFFDDIESQLYKIQNRVLLSRYRGKTTCYDCKGMRLRKEALYVQINGKNIGELSNIPISDLYNWFNNLNLSKTKAEIAERILTEIKTRLKTMLDVGLGYLTLNRLANTLSGGESQRIQLTRSLGSNLTNSVYILDEPSIGLHPRDTENLIGVLKNLRNLGNTVVVVEHDEQIMRAADHIIDMGPLAAHKGGEIIAEGDFKKIIANKKSLTAQYLNGSLKITKPTPVRKPKNWIHIKGAEQNNLKNIDVSFPLHCLCAVTGVSGSGKTTLVKQILYHALLRAIGEASDKPGKHRELAGDTKFISAVELIDQNPIGRSSRSNPVTYVKAYDEIRALYATQPLSKIRGYEPKHFSFNVDGGRCDTCKGEGETIIEMQFLADVHLKCEQCKGQRFKDEILEVKYNGKNIFDVLELSVDEAIEFFDEEKDICQKLKPLQSVGIGYVKLGQSSDTLSGGEAQRIKLASYLSKGRNTSPIFFIFDEPTTGLHFHDIQKLINSFDELIKMGHSICVIEHNMEVVKCADWMIDLGPNAGNEGGHLVYAGQPSNIGKTKNSITGIYLQ